MKPHCTLRNMLVHPKYKRDLLQTAEASYEIPCKNCLKSYVRETGRLFGTRLSEHRIETEKLSDKTITPDLRERCLLLKLKSAITKNVAASNHVIGWDGAKIIGLEPDKTRLKEANWIRSKGVNTMNKDEGAYNLDRIYDQIIEKRQSTSLVTSLKSNTDVAKI